MYLICELNNSEIIMIIIFANHKNETGSGIRQIIRTSNFNSNFKMFSNPQPSQSSE
jgi:hypothetical protein